MFKQLQTNQLIVIFLLLFEFKQINQSSFLFFRSDSNESINRYFFPFVQTTSNKPINRYFSSFVRIQTNQLIVISFLSFEFKRIDQSLFPSFCSNNFKQTNWSLFFFFCSNNQSIVISFLFSRESLFRQRLFFEHFQSCLLGGNYKRELITEFLSNFSPSASFVLYTWISSKRIFIRAERCLKKFENSVKISLTDDFFYIVWKPGTAKKINRRHSKGTRFSCK